MDVKKINFLAEEILSQLEFKENRLLSWGFIEINYDLLEEIRYILENPPTFQIKELWNELSSQGLQIEDIIENLNERRLVFVKNGETHSRYAETFRLLSTLKQRFKFEDWQTAPNLVSNIKPTLRYREYPKRDQTWDSIKEALSENKLDSTINFDVLYKLLKDGETKLSLFQLRSILHILRNVYARQDQSTVIGAGTGAGKTMAFYLPAVTALSASLIDDSSHRTRVLAIYPRVELLKDQFKEALSTVEKINDILVQRKLRPLSVGTYYADTPYSANNVANSTYYNWEKSTEFGGYICPYLVCPECGATLIWRYEDQEKEVERNRLGSYGEYEILYCSDAKCNYFASGENVILTRERMQMTPPDLLFTTTEMLNRALFNNHFQHIFGINASKPPQFVLLDEVHIYNGVTGAQVAYLLRRWLNLVRTKSKDPVQFVGLSATLTNPKTFFSSLSGIPEKNTEYITPSEDELVKEGMEYNLVLRGDPMSKSALLSTSVQTTMLLGRMLDPLKGDVSKGAWGKKIFGFTDKLDVINRWYHIELDAETDLLLSQYRDPELAKKKFDETVLKTQHKLGQIWRRVTDIDKKSLKNPMVVGITTSQSRGVDSNAKLVIATSTLEVGYNDTEIGAVIQHKAPYSIASFLQRKGRAGRLRGMRPWTIVITSAYGRDRWLYENPEFLFNPTLPEINLPLGNIYVQRIQAAFAFMDWLAFKLQQDNTRVNLGDILNPSKNDQFPEEKQKILHLLRQVLNGNNSDMFTFIQNALKVEDNILQRILWTPPRALLLDLIPNLIAKIQTKWLQKVSIVRSKPVRVQSQDIAKDVLPKNPLPGYVTRSLFSTLEINDIEIEIPHSQESVAMPLSQAISEYTPGNVSKRYAKLDKKDSAHWVQIIENQQTLELNKDNLICQRDRIITEGKEEIPLYIPYKIHLKQTPSEIHDKSIAFLQWQVQMHPKGHKDLEMNKGIKVKLIQDSYIGDLIESVEGFMNENNQWVTCIRYAKSLNADLRYKDGRSKRQDVDFSINGTNIAVGFVKEVDAIAIKCIIPDLKKLTTKSEWRKLASELRVKYYLHKLQSDSMLNRTLSKFEIEWLWQTSTSSIIAISVSTQCSIADAIQKYKQNLLAISKRTLEAIFQISIMDSENAEDAKLYKSLMAHIENPYIMEKIIELADVLFNNIEEELDLWIWLEERYKASIAASFQSSINNLLPNLNTEDLLIDIVDNVIWITEPDSGGIGLVSGIIAAIHNYPGRFNELFLEAINYCPREKLGTQLTSVVTSISEGLLDNVTKDIRQANNLSEQSNALKFLINSLSNLGIVPTNDLVVALKSKILNSNSSIETDELVNLLHNKWHEEEARLNCVFDYRIFSVAGLRIPEVEKKVVEILNNFVQREEISEKHKFALIESLLWSVCRDSCPECLQVYSPYSKMFEPSRLLLQILLEPDYITLRYSDGNWRNRLHDLLQSGKKVRLVVSYNDVEKCRFDILELILTPFEIGFELFYPVVNSIEMLGKECYIDICIREVFHD